MRPSHLAGPAVLLACGLGGCTMFPAMAEPRVQMSPYFAAYQLRGEIALQNDPGTGPENNAPQSLRNFGFDRYEDDIGVRTDIGDGFAGFRLDYFRMTMNTSRRGFLDDDFGALLAGDFAGMSATMDEWRVSWLQPVVAAHTMFRDQQLDVQFAAGAVYTQRDLSMHMRTDDGLRTQNLHVGGSNVYPAVRFRAGLPHLALDVDYAISPELNLGGEFDGTMQDVEARLAYSVPFQDVTLFAGWRYSTLVASGHEGPLGFDADLILDGFQFGFTVGF